ncbi:hypothetical protein PH203_49340, partial [Streptomyces sp. S.PB5]|nr:hypothetical protein [Streptomyces sp. S.PB5]
MTGDLLDYSRPGPFTSLDVAQLPLIEGLPDDPVGICAAVQSLVIHPTDAAASGMCEDRIAEKNIRPVNELTGLDPAPLRQARTHERRVAGTCRHFATMACAFLRRSRPPKWCIDGHSVISVLRLCGEFGGQGGFV